MSLTKMGGAIQTDAAKCIGQHFISGADCWKAAEEEYVMMVHCNGKWGLLKSFKYSRG